MSYEFLDGTRMTQITRILFITERRDTETQSFIIFMWSN